VADYKRTADIYFARQDYYSAAEYYAKALENKKDKKASFYPYEMAGKKNPSKSAKMRQYEDLVYRLAESYRNYNDFLSAEKWYEQAVEFNTSDYPLAMYWYGICLRSNGRYADALAQFQQFRGAYTLHDDFQADADKEIANCQFAVSELAKTGTPFTVRKMGGSANEGGANYAPVWWMNRLSFTSSRAVTATVKPTGDKNPYINHLYTSRSRDSAEYAFQRVEIPGQSMEQGVDALTPDGLTLFLTQWTVKDGKKQADLYKCVRSGTGWSEPAKLNTLDLSGFSTMQPAISTDGRYLLFSSDRPGGSGNFDLWYAALDSAANPGTAVNLGAIVNTAGDEEAPYYDAGLKILIFSTNARVGMGNFDLFQSDGDLSNLTVPVNLGYPVNSSKDDMYFTSENTGRKLFKEAYISSDRASSCCLELFKVTRRGKRISGTVVDCDSLQPLDGAKVSLLDVGGGNLVAQMTLDASGAYGFDMDDPGNFKIVVEKDNYFTKSILVHSESMVPADTLYNGELCLKHYFPKRPIVLQNILYDFNSAQLRPESDIVLDTLVGILDENPTMTIELGAHTDSIGSTPYNLKLSDARARSCVDYLISKGIDPARLTSRGYGRCCPIAPEKIRGKDNPAGRQLNRRTEFSVLHK
jgi:outer membrane protein OmpA-like peptidoglycan-associated protein/tetratricopeptide (TPR) repeat protein